MSASSQKPTLRVQINQIDHTITHPGFLDNSSLPRVPIIRIYGPSSTGRKACVHIHQVYPYFFVEYAGEMNPDVVNRYIVRFSKSLNHAIAVSLKRNLHSRKFQSVRAVLLVKGIHFYGFHTSYSPFLKVLITDPAILNRAVTILQSGTIMQTRFRVFESHLGFILQFMCDFGLYGCGWIDLDEVWQRGNDIEDDIAEGSPLTFKSSLHFRESRMDIEVDVASHQILNRHLLHARNIHHKLEIPASPISAEPLVLSVRELWEDERSRRRANGLSPSPELPIDPSENSRGEGGGWDAETMWWNELKQRIENERANEAPLKEDGSWERWIMTTFESVEALWEDRWRVWKPSPRDAKDLKEGQNVNGDNPFGTAAGSLPWNEAGDITEGEFGVDVDESTLSNQEMNQLVELEDIDWERFFEQNTLVDGVDDEEEHFNPHNLPQDSLRDLGLAQGRKKDDYLLSDQSDPFQDLPRKSSKKRPNPFQDAWLQFADRRRSSSMSPDPTTVRATKLLRRVWGGSGSSLKRMTSAPFIQTETPEQNTHKDTIGVALGSMQSQNQGWKTSGPFLPITSSPINSAQINPMLHPKEPLNSQSQSMEWNLHTAVEKTQNVSGNQIASHNITYLTAVNSDERHRSSGSKDFVPDQSSSASKSHSSPTGPSVLPSNPIQPISLSASLSSRKKFHTYLPAPPSASELQGTIDQCGLQEKIYREPYYSNDSDAPEKLRELAGLVYDLKGGEGLSALEEWDNKVDKLEDQCFGNTLLATDFGHITGWEYAGYPPSTRVAKKWLQSDAGRLQNLSKDSERRSQVDGPTPKNVYGLQNTPAAQSDASRARQDMTILSLEIFAPSRCNLAPDPGIDTIASVFYVFQGPRGCIANSNTQILVGKLLVGSEQSSLQRLREVDAEIVPSELELLNRVVDIVGELNPDIIVGWDVRTSSWGYLSARGHHYGFDIGDLISRAPQRLPKGTDQWGERTPSTLKVAGRHVLDLWKIMRHEQTLNIYTFENVVFHVLRRRVPRYSSSTLTKWYNSTTSSHTARVIQYFSNRTSMVLEMLEEAEIITKTAEFARIFGVDFFSVLSRGSQFKVESFMFRIAKPESFVLLSPSKQDVGKQNAAECMPLIMEPLSAFYSSPLVVLDFQSLYPSVMIAYNYCYSTCLGRIKDFKDRYKLGVTELSQPTGTLGTLQEHIRVAPNGIMYTKPNVREGLLGRMLTELLQTRVMVKEAMKNVKGDKALKQILDARQLGLKFICNVTYGYTSATYSGRMPAVEIADSIVQTGRETLEKAVRVINSCQKWGAKVVYGDTDSLFVYLQGRTKAQAFKIGHDIADSITALNPAPIKLKFEKVYLPCVLMAKKRYVGFKYENPSEKEPLFDAKGIETVRRDGVPAQRKIVENCLKILFRTQDLSQVKSYCWRLWMRVLENRVSVQDFIFAKEVRMGSYSGRVPPPPGAVVAAKRMAEDKGDGPQYGERVPYVIVRDGPNLRLIDRAVDPKKVLDNPQMRLDGAYYISRVLIPPLERIFNLVGADVRSWYEEMPKAIKADQPEATTLAPTKDVNRFKIDEHFHNSRCLNCGTLTSDRICHGCRLVPQTTISGLLSQIRVLERRLLASHQTCVSCTDSEPNEPIKCESLDCPWMFERKKAENKVESIRVLEMCIDDLSLDTPSSPNFIEIVQDDDDQCVPLMID